MGNNKSFYEFLRISLWDGAGSFSSFPTTLLSGSDLSSVVMTLILTGIPILSCLRPDLFSAFYPVFYGNLPLSHLFAGFVMSGATSLQGRADYILAFTGCLSFCRYSVSPMEDVETSGQQGE